MEAVPSPTMDRTENSSSPTPQTSKNSVGNGQKSGYSLHKFSSSSLSALQKLIGREAHMDYADHKIINSLTKDNLSTTNIEDAALKYIRRWQLYSDSYPARIKNKVDTFEQLLRVTAKVVFHGKYTKCVSPETKQQLRDKIQDCGFKVDDSPHVLLLCLNFCDVIIDPWSKFMGTKSMTAEDIDNIWKEGWILLDERLEVLMSTKMFGQAANILEIFIAKGQCSLESAEGDTKESFNCFPHERLLQYMIIYVFLWSRNPDKYTSFRSWHSSMFREVVNYLLSSEEERKYSPRLYPQLKEWKKMNKIGSQFVREAIWVQLKRPDADSETLTGLMNFLIEYDAVPVGDNPTDIPLVKSVLSRITEISSTAYLYVLADVIRKNKIGLNEENVNAKVIEIYLRAMTIDMASIDTLKSVADVDKQKVLEIQEKLSEKYEQLANYFLTHYATWFQLILTAHCLRPQNHLYQNLFPQSNSECTSINNIMASVPMAMDSAEELKLPVTIYEALGTVIQHPRWKSICSWTSSQELKALCGRFLETGVDSLIGEQQLEYLNIYSDKFKNLKPSNEHDDDDDGIEKGYGTTDKRKPRRLITITSLMNRKAKASKMFKTRRKNNQPDRKENRNPVAKIKRNFIRKVPIKRPLIRKNKDGKFNINSNHARLLANKQRIQVGNKLGIVCRSIRNQKKNYRVFEASQKHLPPGYEPLEIARIDVSDPQNPKIVNRTESKKYVSHLTTNAIYTYPSLDQSESKLWHLQEHTKKILAESEVGQLNSFRCVKDSFSTNNLNDIRSFRLPKLTHSDVLDAEEKWHRRLSSHNLRGLNLQPNVQLCSDADINLELMELAKESFSLSAQISQLQNKLLDSSNRVTEKSTDASCENSEKINYVNYRLVRPSPKQFQKKQQEKLKCVMLKAYKRRLISCLEYQKIALKEQQSFLAAQQLSQSLRSVSQEPGLTLQDAFVKEEKFKIEGDLQLAQPTDPEQSTIISSTMARDIGRSICASLPPKEPASKQDSRGGSPLKHKVDDLQPDSFSAIVQPHLPNNTFVDPSSHSIMSPNYSTMSATPRSPDSMQCSPDSMAQDLSDDSNLDGCSETDVFNQYPNYNEHDQCLPEDLSVKRMLSQSQYAPPPPFTLFNYNVMDCTRESTLLGIAGGNVTPFTTEEPYANFTSGGAHGVNERNGTENPALLEKSNIQLNHWYANNQAESINPSSFLPVDRFPSSPQSNPLDLTKPGQFFDASLVDNNITSASCNQVNKIKSPRKKGPGKRKSHSTPESVDSLIESVISNCGDEPDDANRCSTSGQPYSMVSDQIPTVPKDLKFCIKNEESQEASNVSNENVISIDQDCKPALAFNNYVKSEGTGNINFLDQPNQDVAKQLQEIIESVPVLKDPLNTTAEIPVNTMCRQEPNDFAHFSGDGISAMEVVVPLTHGKQIGKKDSTLTLSDAGTYCNLQVDESGNGNTPEELPLEPMYTDTAAVAALCDIPKELENPVVISLPKRRTKTRSAVMRQRRNAKLMDVCKREPMVSLVPCDSPNSETFHLTTKYRIAFEASEELPCESICPQLNTEACSATVEAHNDETVETKSDEKTIVDDNNSHSTLVTLTSESVAVTEEIDVPDEEKLQDSTKIENLKETPEEIESVVVDANNETIFENIAKLQEDISKTKESESEEVHNDLVQFEMVETVDYFDSTPFSSDDVTECRNEKDEVLDKSIEVIQLEEEAVDKAVIAPTEKSLPEETQQEEKIEDDEDEVQIIGQIAPKCSTTRRVVRNKKSTTAEKLKDYEADVIRIIKKKTNFTYNSSEHKRKARNFKLFKGGTTKDEHPPVIPNPRVTNDKQPCSLIDDDDEITIIEEVPPKTELKQIKNTNATDLVIQRECPGRMTRMKLGTTSPALFESSLALSCKSQTQSEIQDSGNEKILKVNIERIELNSLTQRNIEQLNLSRNAPSRHNTRLSNKDKTHNKLHESAVDLKRRRNLEIVGDYAKKPKYFDFPPMGRKNNGKKKNHDTESQHDIKESDSLHINKKSQTEITKNISQEICEGLIQCKNEVVEIEVDFHKNVETLSETSLNEFIQNCPQDIAGSSHEITYNSPIEITGNSSIEITGNSPIEIPEVAPTDMTEIVLNGISYIATNDFSDVAPNDFNDVPPNDFNDVPPNDFNDVPPNDFNDVPPNDFNDVPPNDFSDETPNDFIYVAPNDFSSITSNEIIHNSPNEIAEKGRNFEEPLEENKSLQTYLEKNEILQKSLKKNEGLLKSLEKNESSKESLEKNESSKESLEKKKSLQESMEKNEILQESMNNNESSEQFLEKNEILLESLEKNEISDESLEKNESYEESLEEKESLQKSLEEKESLQKSLEENESCEESLEEKESLQKSLEKNESCEESLEEKESCEESLEKKESCEESLEEKESCGESLEKKESCGESLEEKESLQKTLEKNEILLESLENNENSEESMEKNVSQESMENNEMSEESTEKSKISEESIEKNEILEESLEKNEIFEESLEKNQSCEESMEKYEMSEESMEKNKISLQFLEKNESCEESMEENESCEESMEENESCEESMEENESCEESMEENESCEENMEENESCEESMEKNEICEKSLEKSEHFEESLEKKEHFEESMGNNEISEESMGNNEISEESMEKNEIAEESLEKNESCEESTEKNESWEEAMEENEISEEYMENNEISEEYMENNEISEESMEKNERFEESMENNKISEESMEKNEIAEESMEKNEISEESMAKNESCVESMEKNESWEETMEKNEISEESMERNERFEEYMEKNEISDESLEKNESCEKSMEKNKICEESMEKNEILLQFLDKNQSCEESRTKNDGFEESLEKNRILLQSLEKNDSFDEPQEENEGLQVSLEENEGLQVSLEENEILQESLENNNSSEESLENNESFEESLENNESFEESLENNERCEESMGKNEVLKASLEKNEILQESLEMHEIFEESQEENESLQECLEDNEISEESLEKKESFEESQVENKSLQECLEKDESFEESCLPVLRPISPPPKRRKTQRDFDPPPMLDFYND